jgi:RNA polymerase primary sigma factor
MDPSALKELPRDVLSRVLKSLSYREREILKLIAGVGDGFRYTSEEVAHIFKGWVVRERQEQSPNSY